MGDRAGQQRATTGAFYASGWDSPDCAGQTDTMEDAHSMRDIGLTALAPLIWGTTYIVTTEFLPPDRPLLAGLMRALPVGVLLLLLFRRLPKGIWWGRTLVLGALNIGLFFPLFFLAVYRLPGGVAATLSAFQPFLVALFGW